MPPQTNATVTAVAGSGSGDDWDRPAVAGGAKWAGVIRAYYREATDRVAAGAGGTVDVAVRRELIVDTAALDELGLDTDDVVTFHVDGYPAESTGTARTIRRASLANIEPSLQTAKITLEDA